MLETDILAYTATRCDDVVEEEYFLSLEECLVDVEGIHLIAILICCRCEAEGRIGVLHAGTGTNLLAEMLESALGMFAQRCRNTGEGK